MMQPKIFFAFILFVALSCARNEEPQQTSDLLPGQWQLAWVSGGISGKGYTPEFNVLHFLDGNRYELRQDNALKAQGVYALFPKGEETWIRFTHESSTEQPFEGQEKKVEADRSHLILSDPCCDLFEYHFNKKR